VSAVVLDAGALVGVDRDDREVVALLVAARRAGWSLRTNANVVAQVWRDDRGRQVHLGRFLRSVEVRAVDDAIGRAAGVLLARAGTRDVVDATVVLMAASGDQILTSDRGDIANLLAVTATTVDIVEC
jgi:hypothetical protein